MKVQPPSSFVQDVFDKPQTLNWKLKLKCSDCNQLWALGNEKDLEFHTKTLIPDSLIKPTLECLKRSLTIFLLLLLLTAEDAEIHQLIIKKSKIAIISIFSALRYHLFKSSIRPNWTQNAEPWKSFNCKVHKKLAWRFYQPKQKDQQF